MSYQNTEYRERRREDCRKLLEGFVLDLSRSHNPGRIERVLELSREGYFSHEIAAELGISPKAVQKVWRRYNFPSLSNFSPPREAERPQWKGGVKIVKGYSYKRSPWHPNKSKHGGYVAVHRLVVEEHLGRFLNREEVVDHIDGDTQNNRIENLRVFATNAEHLRATLTGRKNNMSPENRKKLSEKMKKYHAKRRAEKLAAIPVQLEIGA